MPATLDGSRPALWGRLIEVGTNRARIPRSTQSVPLGLREAEVNRGRFNYVESNRVSSHCLGLTSIHVDQ
jgi:hypothetical protein